jgi:methylated-DNA-[protein]-cysteine S-methyltransferase
VSRYAFLDSPLGRLLAVRDDVGITGLYLPSGRHPVSPDPLWAHDQDAFDDLRAELAQYFAGTRRTFSMPLHPTGTDFQLRVWQALRAIPCGETTTYGRIAAEIGLPNGARAVGLANGQNPISIVVPCHRVIGADGTLVGYGGGLPAKRWLLAHEAARAGLFEGLTTG